MKNAIILCSGGLDSVVTSYYVKKKLNYDKIIILFFNYNQKSIKKERICSRYCAKKINADFIEIKIENISKFSKSLINSSGKIKELKRSDLKDTKKEGMKFYVPCRNTIFLSYALALAEFNFINNKQIFDIFVGFKNEGKESYPDTTQKFVNKFNELSAISCNKSFKVYAPLIRKDKEDIILLGKRLNVDFKKTHSCYLSNIACGKCLACMLRKEGFYWSGVDDERI